MKHSHQIQGSIYLGEPVSDHKAEIIHLCLVKYHIALTSVILFCDFYIHDRARGCDHRFHVTLLIICQTIETDHLHPIQ